jgi:hypothetical protein
MRTKFSSESLKGRNHSDVLGIDGRMEWILVKEDEELWSGCIWLRLGTNGVLF